MPDLETINQSTRAAAGAPALAIDPAKASPFAMGAQYLSGRPAGAEEAGPAAEQERAPAAAPTASTGRTVLRPRAIETLAACGPLTVEQLAEGLGAEVKTVNTLVKNCLSAGLFVRAQDREGNQVVQLADAKQPRGLKRYLAQQGAKDARKAARGAGGGRKAAKSAQAAKAAPSPAHVKRARRAACKAGELPVQLQRSLGVVPAPSDAQAGLQGFAVGLFSDGHLEIHAGADRIDLTRAQVRGLVAYLDMVASAIREGAGHE